MEKALVIIFSIILYLAGEFWLFINKEDTSKCMSDFCAIALIVISVLMLLVGIFYI